MAEENGTKAVARRVAGNSVTGFHTDGKADGVLELAVPNLLPTDNVSQVVDAELKRIRFPVRITNVNLRVVDNGFVVTLPEAGMQNRWGPDGAHHVFSGEDAKRDMLEFVATVIGQVTYSYREVEREEADYPVVEVE